MGRFAIRTAPSTSSCGERNTKSENARAMRITLTGLSYKSAPVELRERLAVEPDRVSQRLLGLHEVAGWEECALLATCNRMEVVALAAPDEDVGETSGQEWLSDWLARQAQVSEPQLRPH